MGTVRFKMGQIGNDAQIMEMVTRYRREMDRKKMPNTWPESNLYHYAALFYEDEPVSLLLYAPIEDHKKVYSVGAYTTPTWRHLGVYTFIWKLCVNEWRKEGVYEFFQSGYHKDNWVSAAMQESQGRVIYEEKNDHMRTRFSLQPTGEEFDITPDHLMPMTDLFDRLSG